MFFLRDTLCVRTTNYDLLAKNMFFLPFLCLEAKTGVNRLEGCGGCAESHLDAATVLKSTEFG